MTYIVFSSFLGLVALAIAIVPVTVILRRERQAGLASAALLRTTVGPDQEEWPVAA